MKNFSEECPCYHSVYGRYFSRLYHFTTRQFTPILFQSTYAVGVLLWLICLFLCQRSSRRHDVAFPLSFVWESLNTEQVWCVLRVQIFFWVCQSQEKYLLPLLLQVTLLCSPWSWSKSLKAMKESYRK